MARPARRRAHDRPMRHHHAMQSAASTFEAFIAAFNALDIERFRRCLAPDVTLFAPRAADAQRIDGAAAVEAHFAAVFRGETPAGPDIRPSRVRVSALGPEAALVTFEFARGHGSIGRRTLVLRRVDADWRIAHIHASNTEPG
jgi:ketosteroid isomerase-like protein